MKDRKIFFKQLKESNKTLLDIIPLIDPKSYYYQTILHDATILEELPIVHKKLLGERHELRCWISRILLKNNLPSDLVPTIAAFTVTGTKIWNYM